MKIFLKSLFLMVVLFLLFVFSSKTATAQCGGGGECIYLEDCSKTVCFQCTGCQNGTFPHRPLNPGPTEPTEDIAGKVTNPILSDRLKTMPGDTFLNNFLRTGINLILLIGAVIFFFVLTSGGVKWLSSSGDKAKLESAQKQISSGLVGLAILLSTFVIIKVIETLFGISLLQFTMPTL